MGVVHLRPHESLIGKNAASNPSITSNGESSLRDFSAVWDPCCLTIVVKQSKQDSQVAMRRKFTCGSTSLGSSTNCSHSMGTGKVSFRKEMKMAEMDGSDHFSMDGSDHGDGETPRKTTKFHYKKQILSALATLLTTNPSDYVCVCVTGIVTCVPTLATHAMFSHIQIRATHPSDSSLSLLPLESIELYLWTGSASPSLLRITQKMDRGWEASP